MQPVNQETSLMTLLKDHCMKDITPEMISDHAMSTFLAPNETNPEDMLPHLREVVKTAENVDLVISTGTERLFFFLALCPVEFKRLIHRDINPQTYCYNYFNIILLRISNSVQEYNTLSENIKKSTINNIETFDEFQQRILIVSEKIKSDNSINNETKEFYLKNIKCFAKIYLSCSQRWRAHPKYQKCWYFENENQFKKIQDYAKSEKIVCTIGDINDIISIEKILTANKIGISLIDTSNIHKYSIYNFNINETFQTRIMATYIMSASTIYVSWKHYPLKTEEISEFNELLDIVKKNKNYASSLDYMNDHLTDNLYNTCKENNCAREDCLGFCQRLNYEVGPVYSKKNLEKLRLLAKRVSYQNIKRRVSQ